MKINLKRPIPSIRPWIFILIFSVFLCSPAIAIERLTEHKSADMVKILSLLENRIGDPKFLEKVKSKVSTLSERQILLISSLSERIVRERRKTGVDIAYLMIAALIVLS